MGIVLHYRIFYFLNNWHLQQSVLLMPQAWFFFRLLDWQIPFGVYHSTYNVHIMYLFCVWSLSTDSVRCGFISWCLACMISYAGGQIKIILIYHGNWSEMLLFSCYTEQGWKWKHNDTLYNNYYYGWTHVHQYMSTGKGNLSCFKGILKSVLFVFQFL